MNDLKIPGGREKILVQLDANICMIKDDMVVILDKFFDIGKTLSYIQEHKLFKLKDYKNFIEFCKKEFSLSKNQAYNLVAIYERFNKPEFKAFNYSQLTEMLSLSDEQLQKVNEKMSSKKIREIKKDDKKEKEEEDIHFGEQIVIQVAPEEVVEELPFSKQPLKKQLEFYIDRCNLITEEARKQLDEQNRKIKDLENENAELASKLVDASKEISSLKKQLKSKIVKE